ncbi:MAG: oligosaccharide flippase family protein [Balneolaceae bacterium]|nr:oligosaccharide flippase family protein [Balneolaceae bacterium]
MGIIVRQSIANTFISYVGVGLGFVTTVWLYPRILDPEEYGLTRVLLSLGLVSMQLANLGISNTIVRFFSHFKDDPKNREGFLFWILFVPFIGYLLYAAFIILSQDLMVGIYTDRSPLFGDYYWYLLPMVFFMVYFSVLTNYIRAQYDTIPSQFLMDVVLRIVHILNLIAYFYGLITFDQFIAIFVFNYGLQLLLLILYMILNSSITFRPGFRLMAPKKMKTLSTYGLYAFLGGVATIIVGNIDIIMLGALAGLEDTGIYGIAFYIGSVIAIPLKSIQKISSPIVANAFRENDLSLIETIYKKSSINQIIAGGLLFIGVWANLDNLAAILPQNYYAGGAVILVIGAANLFNMATGINGSIILNSKLYRFDLYSTIFLVIVTIGLNYYLIPLYGILGAAIATAASIFLYNLIKFLFVQIKFSMQPFEKNTVAVILVGLLTMLVIEQIGRISGTYVDLMLRSAIVTLLFLGPIYLLNLSEDFTGLIRSAVSRIHQYFAS